MDRLTAHDHDYDPDSSHASTGSSHSSPSVDLTQHPRTPTTGYAADSSGPYTLHHSHLRSSNTIPTVAAHLASCNLFPTSKQWPNTMTALQTASPSATDSVTGAVQAALGLYISAPFLSPYLTIPPSIDNNYLHNRPVPSPNHRTNLLFPDPHNPTTTTLPWKGTSPQHLPPNSVARSQ
jgi:hypothetical protein